MDSKVHTYRIQKREPLQKFETITLIEATFDEVCQMTSEWLSPAIAEGGTGTAFSVRFERYTKNDWTYIPQWS